MLKNTLKNLTQKIYKKNKWTTTKKFYSQEATVVDLPLSTPLSSTPKPVSEKAASEILQKKRTYEETTLNNGLTIQSTDYNQSANSVISVVVNSGSRFENYETSGISHFIGKFFFDNTNTRSKMNLVSEMQKTGGTVSSASDRENIIYRTESVREAVPTLLTLVNDSVLQGRLHEWDLFPQAEAVKQDLVDYSSSPEVLLNEAMHRTAFNGKNLGNPLICPSYNVNNITIDDIVSRMDTYFNPWRMKIVGTNINHEDLVYLSRWLFGEFPMGTGDNSGLESASEQSEYSGGDFQMHQTRNTLTDAGTQSVLAFRGVGNNDNDVVALEVLQNLLGNTKTRNLERRATFGTQGVLNNNLVKNLPKSAGVIHEASAFNINYSDDGLFGIKLSGDSPAVGESINKSLQLLNLIASKGVCQMNLNRGKNKAKFNYFANLETSIGVHEAQLAYSNPLDNHHGFAFDSVTSEDLQRVTKNLLKNKPTLVSYGELAHIPTLFDLSK